MPWLTAGTTRALQPNSCFSCGRFPFLKAEHTFRWERSFPVFDLSNICCDVSLFVGWITDALSSLQESPQMSGWAPAVFCSDITGLHSTLILVLKYSFSVWERDLRKESKYIVWADRHWLPSKLYTA